MYNEINLHLLSASVHDEFIEGRNQLILTFYGRDQLDRIFKVRYSKFKPYYFKQISEESIFRTLDNKYVKKFELNSFKEWRSLQNQNNFSYEQDVYPIDRFLMDNKIFGAINVKYHTELKSYESDLIEVEAKDVNASEIDSNFSLFSFDIETSKSNKIISIAYDYHFKNERIQKVYILKDNVHHKHTANSLNLNWCVDEVELLVNFFNDFKKLNPDIVLGWNVVGFDFLYIFKKCKDLKLKMDLGRSLEEVEMYEIRPNDWKIKIPGRVVLDGPKTLKANFYSFESFKLNFVAKEILGESKDIDEDEVDDKWGEIERRYQEDPKALCKYNLKDATLVTDIFQHLNIIALLKSRVKISGMLFEKIGGSTAAFDHYYLPYLHSKNLVAPNVKDVISTGQSTGGYVLEPVVGVHEDVVVLDFKSLYPTVISTFKIDPVSLFFNKVNTSNTPAGINFSKTEGYLPGLIDYFLEQRRLAKNNKDPYLSQSIKILMNSFYGVMGSSGCRFYHPSLPQAITLTGQWVLKTAIDYIEEKNLKVIYGDTDSIFVKVDNLEDENINLLVNDINFMFSEKIKTLYGLESRLEIQYDKKFKSLFLSPTRSGINGAKKKYAGYKVQKDGSTYLEMTGMEFVRSDWCKNARDFQFSLIERFLQKLNIEEWLKNYIQNLRENPPKEGFSMKKRLSKPTSNYDKILPPHVVAARALEEKRKVRVNLIEFVMTKRGPMPIQLPHDDIDIDYYIQKQIKPLAEMILGLQNKKFDDIISGEQLSLF